MDWSLNSFWQILPLPILIGMLIWTFSVCLFSLFLITSLILLNRRCSTLNELISIKEISNETKYMCSVFSHDSLSLISCQTTRKDLIDDPISSFYLANSYCVKQNPITNSFPSIKSKKIKQNSTKQINSLPILSTRRSIIPHLTSVSNSLKDKKLHQSIDSLFSKDSLCE